MKNLMIFILFLLSLMPVYMWAQSTQDTIKKTTPAGTPLKPEPYHKNVIKFNPTPMMIWGQTRNITLSYERMITRNQSASIQLGYLLFPRLFDDTIANLISITSRARKGMNIALDYRFYPLSRNRRPAPDGLYIGAYVSYYGFDFRNNFDLIHVSADQNGSFHGRLSFLNVGMSLGYQFIFWKRFTLDMLLFGPSVSSYSGKLTVYGDLDEDQIENIDQEVVDKLLNRFPVLKTLFSTNEMTFTGSRTKFGVGFRYSIQIGFHF
jgi:hypothetical protein